MEGRKGEKPHAERSNMLEGKADSEGEAERTVVCEG